MKTGIVVEYPEEVKRNFWLRELRTSDGLDIDDYLDWLFFNSKEDDAEEA